MCTTFGRTQRYTVKAGQQGLKAERHTPCKPALAVGFSSFTDGEAARGRRAERQPGARPKGEGAPDPLCAHGKAPQPRIRISRPAAGVRLPGAGRVGAVQLSESRSQKPRHKGTSLRVTPPKPRPLQPAYSEAPPFGISAQSARPRNPPPASPPFKFRDLALFTARPAPPPPPTSVRGHSHGHLGSPAASRAPT